MKKNIWKLLCLLPLFTACIDDDGNYTYTELAEITVENIPERIEVLGYVDRIQISPKIISSTEGEIKPGDPNYTVRYRLGYKGMGSIGGAGYDENGEFYRENFIDITPEGTFDLDIPADYGATTYVCWMTITDNRNNAVTSLQFDINVSSTTGEGWLVLCNEGEEERVRLDMISQLTSTRVETIYDVAAGLPESYQATCLGFAPKGSSPGDVISIFTHGTDYMLDNATLESGPELEFNMNNFSIQPDETLFKEYAHAATTYDWMMKYRFGFAESGNAYCLVGGSSGEAYGMPINTLEPGKPVSFRVAPYCGFNQIRPWGTKFPANVLFYDIDNKRFMYFAGTTGFVSEDLCMYPLEEPEIPLFSYTTGKDMVYMEGTARNGLVCAILQDASGNRSLYGINVAPSEPTQELYIDNIDAPQIKEATQFAFYSRGPLMFYAAGNKVYMYNYATQTSRLVEEVALGENEEITQIKFNLFRNSLMENLNKYGDEAFMNKQYQLVVASYDNSAAGVDNGKVGFYAIEQNGLDYTATKAEEYTGFAKVVDVVYRERRK